MQPAPRSSLNAVLPWKRYRTAPPPHVDLTRINILRSRSGRGRCRSVDKQPPLRGDQSWLLLGRRLQGLLHGRVRFTRRNKMPNSTSDTKTNYMPWRFYGVLASVLQRARGDRKSFLPSISPHPLVFLRAYITGQILHSKLKSDRGKN